MISNSKFYSVFLLLFVIIIIILGNLYYEYLEKKYYTEGNDGSPLIVVQTDIPKNAISEIDETKDQGMISWLKTDRQAGNMRMNTMYTNRVEEWVDQSYFGSNLTPSIGNETNVLYTTWNSLLLQNGTPAKGIYINRNKKQSIEMGMRQNNMNTRNAQTTTAENTLNMKEYLFFVFATMGDTNGSTSAKLHLLGPSVIKQNNRQIYINENKIYYGCGALGSNGKWVNVNITHGLTKGINVLECCLTIDKNVTIMLNNNLLFNDSNQTTQVLNYLDTNPINDYICIGTGANIAPNQKSDMDLLAIELLVYNKNVTEILTDVFIEFVRKRRMYPTYLGTQGFQNMIESFGIKESFRNKWSFNNTLIQVTPFKDEIKKDSITGYEFNHASKNIIFTINNTTNEDYMYLNGNYKIIYNSSKYNGDENNSPLNAFADKLPDAPYPPVWSIKLPPNSEDTFIELHLPYYFVLKSYTFAYATNAPLNNFKYQLWRYTDPIDDPWNTKLSDQWYSWGDRKSNSKNDSPIINSYTYYPNYPFKPTNTTERVSYGHAIRMVFSNTSSVEVSLDFNLSMNGYYIYELETDEEMQCYIDVSPVQKQQFGDKNMIAFNRHWRAIGHNESRNPHSCSASNTS